MIKKILIAVLILLIAFAVYVKSAISKFDYKLEVLSYKIIKIDLQSEAIINILLKITLFNSLFFPLPVNLLYYEIYFKDSLIGRSAGATAFEIAASPAPTVITESVDLIMNKANIEVAQNYIFKKPTEFTVKVVTDLFGITINLKNIKFTY